MKNTIEGILLIVGLIILAGMLFGGPLMLLWNWLMPGIFGLPQIGFWQAFGLQSMAGLLFKSNVTIKKND